MSTSQIGWSGRRYVVTNDSPLAQLPDGTLLSLTLEMKDGIFVPTGEPELLAAHQVKDRVPVLAELDKSGKNMLLGRYRFRYAGVYYEVSQEVYPDAYIQLPQPNWDVVLAVGAWSLFGIAHQIAHVHRVGNPDDRPRVWATCASDFVCFEYSGQTYKVGRVAYSYHLPILLPDGRWIKPKGWRRSSLYKPEPVDIEICSAPASGRAYCEADLVEVTRPR